MKMRQGFVSNSSSSSFVVLLPAGFTITDISAAEVAYSEASKEQVEEALFELLNEGTVWNEEDRNFANILSEVLKKYIIAKFESGPEGCKIILADEPKARKILEKR